MNEQQKLQQKLAALASSGAPLLPETMEWIRKQQEAIQNELSSLDRSDTKNSLKKTAD